MIPVREDFISLFNLLEWKLRFPDSKLEKDLLSEENLTTKFKQLLENPQIDEWEFENALAAFFNSSNEMQMFNGLNQSGALKAMTGLEKKDIAETVDLLIPCLYLGDPYLSAQFLCLFLITHMCFQNRELREEKDFENIPFVRFIRKIYSSSENLNLRLNCIRDWALSHFKNSLDEYTDYGFSHMLKEIKKYHDLQHKASANTSISSKVKNDGCGLHTQRNRANLQPRVSNKGLFSREDSNSNQRGNNLRVIDL